jgi:hypothetical protein
MAADIGSGGDLEQRGDEAGLQLHVAPTDVPNLSLSHYRPGLLARQGSSRRMEAAEAPPRSGHPLRPGQLKQQVERALKGAEPDVWSTAIADLGPWLVG